MKKDFANISIERPISRRILFYILLVSSITTTVFTAISFYIDYKSEMSLFSDNHYLLEQSIQEPLGIAMWMVDSNQIESLIKSAAIVPGVTKVILIDESAQVLAQHLSPPPKEDPDITIRSLIFSIADDQHIEKRFPIHYEFMGQNRKIGELIVMSNTKLIFGKLYYKAFVFFATQGFKTLIVSMLILLILYFTITRHLHKIVHRLQSFDYQGKGEDPPKFTLGRKAIEQHDELDILEAVVNFMQTSVFRTNQMNAKEILARDEKIEKERRLAEEAGRRAHLCLMAGGIAHEINNPLASIDGSAKLLKKLAKESELNLEDNQLIQETTTTITKNASRIANIVQNLLEFSGASLQGRNEDMLLTEVIEELEKYARTTSGGHGISIKTEIDAIYDRFSCRPLALMQVLKSLINNAVEAMMDQDYEDKWILIKGESDLTTQTVAFSIIDSGQGIDSDIESKMFVPFFSTKPIGRGKGLGLPTSVSLLESLSGTLSYDGSAPNTTFSVSIPMNLTYQDEVALSS